MMKRATTLACLGVLAGCAELPDRQLVIEHRILAARIDVLEDPMRTEAMPLETVELTPFFVGPSGVVDAQDVDPLWIACELFPGRGPLACVQEATPLRVNDLRACEAPTFDDFADGPPEVPSPCLMGRVAVPQLTVPVSAGVLAGADYELTLIASTPGETPTDECAAQFLSGESDLPDDCMYAVQVLRIGPKPQLLELAEAAGFDLEGLDIPRPEVIDEPDRNPRITKFTVTVLDEDGEEVTEAQDVELGGTVEVEIGQTLRIDTKSPRADLQDFQIPINNGADFEPRTEAYFGDWFRTWGDLLSGFSADPKSYNEWTFERGDQDETDRPPGGEAHLYYVVRDSRAGVNWWHFTAVVKP